MNFLNMSYIKRLYGKQETVSLGLTTLLLAICSCSCGLVYIEDKTFTSNYIEGDVIYTDNHTASKFIHCVSICIKECAQPCSLISFTDGTCRCHSSYARRNNGQNDPNRNKTMYFRIADKNDERLKETSDTTTAETTSTFESSSRKEGKSENSSIPGVMCNNPPSTIDVCKPVSNDEYYINVFNTYLDVTFDTFSHKVFLIENFADTFSFERQVDGHYLIYARYSTTRKYYLYVNGSYLYVRLSDSSSPVNQTYYYLEYQPEGSFKFKVKSLDNYIARSNSFLKVTNTTYGDDGKFLIETTRPAWNISFRIPTGSPYNIYQAFLYGKKQLMTNSCEVNNDGTCKYSFSRNDDILRDWRNGCLSVCKIKYSLMRNNMEVLACVFDGVNTSPETWFVATKLQRCSRYQNITDLSMTAAESGDWFFKVTDKRRNSNVLAAHYGNQTDPSRKLTAVIFDNEFPGAEVQISVTVN